MKQITTIPYFYIIKHNPSNRFYAGCRYAKGCHPDELLKRNGYTTSSNLVNALIWQDGLESFEIILTDTDTCGLHVREFEHLFLKEYKCSSSPEWLNCHDNKAMFGTEEYRLIMQYKYGVDYYLQTKECRERLKITSNERYGVDNPMQAEEVKENHRKTCLQNLGVENPSQSEEIKQKKKETCIEHCGFDHHNKTPENRKLQSLRMKEQCKSGKMSKIFICEICSREIKSPGNYKQHLGRHERKGEITFN